MKKSFLILISILMLSACGTTSNLTEADLAKKIPAGYARIIVKREVAFSYAGAGALVEVNGKTLGTLGQSGEAFLDVKAGSVSVSVQATGAIGNPYGYSSTSIKAKAGKTYRFVVSPNTSRFMKTAAFGSIFDAMNHSGIDDNYFKVVAQDE